MPELRKDPVAGHWVIIATERAKRPVDYKADHGAPTGGRFCPFCPGQEQKTPNEVFGYRDAAGAWKLRVVPNKFPALMIEGDLGAEGDGPYDRMNGVGAHEVLIESPAHDKRLHELDDAQVELVLRAYRERILDLRKDTRFRYVMVFKNHGAASGATLEHPHSQLIALPVVPVTVQEELTGAAKYHAFHDRCLFCDMTRHELRDGRRVIHENAEFIVLAPYAPRFPFETWIVPKRHGAAFEGAPLTTLAPLAAAIRTALKKLTIALDDPPYNFVLHTAPFDAGNAQYHWHFEIIPTLGKMAGFEWGSGFFINPTPPEDAAAFLRELSE